jgi:hypothetical protein
VRNFLAEGRPPTERVDILRCDVAPRLVGVRRGPERRELRNPDFEDVDRLVDALDPIGSVRRPLDRCTVGSRTNELTNAPWVINTCDPAARIMIRAAVSIARPNIDSGASSTFAITTVWPRWIPTRDWSGSPSICDKAN